VHVPSYCCTCTQSAVVTNPPSCCSSRAVQRSYSTANHCRHTVQRPDHLGTASWYQWLALCSPTLVCPAVQQRCRRSALYSFFTISTTAAAFRQHCLDLSLSEFSLSGSLPVTPPRFPVDVSLAVVHHGRGEQTCLKKPLMFLPLPCATPSAYFHLRP